MTKETSFPSTKNGMIVVRKTPLKGTGVFVNQFDQSSRYTRIMFRGALRRLPWRFCARRILMLGLGGGSIIQLLQRKFPGCAITVVEWDPVMIALYPKLRPADAPITIIKGDAITIVPAMTHTFDLVIVDLFTGNATPTALQKPHMIAAIAARIAPGGLCLLNAFVSLQLIPLFGAALTLKKTWRYKFNTLALYETPPLSQKN